MFSAGLTWAQCCQVYPPPHKLTTNWWRLTVVWTSRGWVPLSSSHRDGVHLSHITEPSLPCGVGAAAAPELEVIKPNQPPRSEMDISPASTLTQSRITVTACYCTVGAPVAEVLIAAAFDKRKRKQSES